MTGPKFGAGVTFGFWGFEVGAHGSEFDVKCASGRFFGCEVEL